MPPIRFVKRLIDDSYVVNEPLQAVRHLPRASRAMARRALDSLSVESTVDLQAGIRVIATRAAHHRSSIGVRARYHGGDARAWLFTVKHNVHVSKIRRISAQPRAVKAYSFAEDSSRRGRQISWIGEI
jgi:hypothetical protein